MSGSKFVSTSGGLRGDVQEAVTKELLVGSTIVDINTDESGGFIKSITLKSPCGKFIIVTVCNGVANREDGDMVIEVDGKKYP